MTFKTRQKTVLGDIMNCMKKILTTKGKYAIVDDKDFEEINKNKWRVNDSTGKVYAVRELNKDGKRWTEHMHRVILGKKIGRSLSSKELTDHINGIGLDNRRENLRVCNQTLNMGNSRLRKDNTTGHKGVHFNKAKNKFEAYVNFMGKRFRLGRFKDIKDAIKKRDKKYIELYGEFARL